MLNEEFMHCAIQHAREAIAEGNAPFGTAIVKDDVIIACEHNQVFTRKDVTAHSTMIALQIACEKLGKIDLSGAHIYSTNEPCTMCYSACNWAKIERIVFGTSIEDIHRLGFREIMISNKRMQIYEHAAVPVEGNFLRYDNLSLLEEWEKKTDKRVY